MCLQLIIIRMSYHLENIYLLLVEERLALFERMMDFSRAYDCSKNVNV